MPSRCIFYENLPKARKISVYSILIYKRPLTTIYRMKRVSSREKIDFLYRITYPKKEGALMAERRTGVRPLKYLGMSERVLSYSFGKLAGRDI